jgi:hypothetical protein
VKESKFIELLNLYIDQQISPPDAAQLEAEILHDPQRRRTYREYCQLHRACTLVFEDSRVRAEAEEPDRVIELAPRRRAAWGYYAAGLAAAACVALVAVQAWRTPAAIPRPAAVVAVAAPAAVVPVALRMDASSPRGYNLTAAAFVADRLNLLSPGRLQNSTSLVFVNGPAPLRRLTAVKASAAAARPSIEQWVFEQSAPDSAAPQVFRVRQNGDSPEEMAAYQFQR